ncbi:hypothetical protein RF11_07070 [Thelohanellus kitauei]|uniref:Uncharacterized protein n=1 Tax=Thelohanellus kitauei TaxID=669202 RepID=A0A0C2IZE0_THEKT|nr:hypothetical protein RF11_07070 [Thelohanellus kitauei]
MACCTKDQLYASFEIEGTRGFLNLNALYKHFEYFLRTIDARHFYQENEMQLLFRGPLWCRDFEGSLAASIKSAWKHADAGSDLFKADAERREKNSHLRILSLNKRSPFLKILKSSLIKRNFPPFKSSIISTLHHLSQHCPKNGSTNMFGPLTKISSGSNLFNCQKEMAHTRLYNVYTKFVFLRPRIALHRLSWEVETTNEAVMTPNMSLKT